MICRVAYVLKDYPRLSQTFVLNEIVGLLSRGIDVLVLALNHSGEVIHHELAKSSQVTGRIIFHLESFERALTAFSPDLIHAHFATIATETALRLGAKLGIPVTFTAHGYDIFRSPPPNFSARANLAARVITVSKANQRYLVERLGVNPNQITVIPNGVDTSYFAPNLIQTNHTVPQIVCVARLEPVKQHQILLAACALMKTGGISYRCTIVGDGSCRESLHALRDSLQLRDHVEFTGAADSEQVQQFWRSADVAVLSSQSEGFPVCLLEAAATGIPAVAPSVGGIPEIIVHESTGLLVTPDDPDSLADALKRFCYNLALAGQMGKNARRLALQNFSIDQQLNSLLAVWDQVISSR